MPAARRAGSSRQLARPELAADWLPLAPVAGPDGTLYRIDPERDLLLARRALRSGVSRRCPASAVRVFATGRFDTADRPGGRPRDGRVYVADAGNARVQVIDRGDVGVVAVLSDGLVAAGPCGAGAVRHDLCGRRWHRSVHVFGADFDAAARSCRSPRSIPGPTRELDRAAGARSRSPSPCSTDGTLAVFDPMRPALWHMTAGGTAAASLCPGPTPELPPGWSPAPRRFAAEGEVILGPIDGGTHDLAWHRVLIDADLPPGSTDLGPDLRRQQAIRRRPARGRRARRCRCRRPGRPTRGEHDRLVLRRPGWLGALAARPADPRPARASMRCRAPARAASTADRCRRDRASLLLPGDVVALDPDAGGAPRSPYAPPAPAAHSSPRPGPTRRSPRRRRCA